MSTDNLTSLITEIQTEGMKTGDWVNIGINSLVAIGTILLAIFAFVTIFKTKNEYRNKQLDDIIEWATNLIEQDFSNEQGERVKKADNPWVQSWLILGEEIEKFESLRRKSNVFYKSIIKLNDDSLTQKYKQIQMELENHKILIGNSMSNIPLKENDNDKKFNEAMNKVGIHKKEINQLCLNLIDIAIESQK